MHGEANGSLNDMASGYFEKPPSRARPLIGFKAPQALKDRLDALELLWQLRARVEGAQKIATTKFKDAAEKTKAEEKLDAEIRAIDFTHVCNRLMNLASEEAISEILKQIGFEHVPASTDEWAQAETAFLKTAKARK